MAIPPEWIFDRPGIAITAHVGFALFAASGIAQPIRASSLDNVQVQFLLPNPSPMDGSEAGRAGLARADRAAQSLQPGGTVHRVFAVSEPNKSATIKLAWDGPAAPQSVSGQSVSGSLAIPLEADTGARIGMESETGLVRSGAQPDEAPLPTATVFRIAVDPEPAPMPGIARLAQGRRAATNPAPSGPNRLGATIATALPQTTPGRGELLLETLADEQGEAELITAAAPGKVGPATQFAATIKQAGDVSGASRFDAKRQRPAMAGDELKSMMRAVVASRDTPAHPLGTDVYRAERPAGPQNRLADSRTIEHTASARTYSGRSMSDETDITRYQRTGNGIEFNVPTKINGTMAGNVPLLIADKQNISVKLGEILALIEPMMDKAEFAALSASSSANEFVTLNDLRAAGISVSFDKHDRLVLRAS